jgi:hypothetical protein
MRTLTKSVLFSVFFILFIALSCGEEDPPITPDGPFNISELTGNWEATFASFIRDSDDMAVEIVGDGGTVTMVVQSNGRFTMTIDPADRAAYTVSGKMFWEIWEGNYYFSIEWADYPGDWDSYGATLIGDTLEINGSFETGEYDFDNDGSSESARVRFTFVRG